MKHTKTLEKGPMFKIGTRVVVPTAERRQSKPQYVLENSYDERLNTYIVALTEDGHTCCGTVTQYRLVEIK